MGPIAWSSGQSDPAVAVGVHGVSVHAAMGPTGQLGSTMVIGKEAVLGLTTQRTEGELVPNRASRDQALVRPLRGSRLCRDHALRRELVLMRPLRDWSSTHAA